MQLSILPGRALNASTSSVASLTCNFLSFQIWWQLTAEQHWVLWSHHWQLGSGNLPGDAALWRWSLRPSGEVIWRELTKDILKSLGWRKSPKWFTVTVLESCGCCGNRHQNSSFLCCFWLEHVHKRVISAVIWNRELCVKLEKGGEVGQEKLHSLLFLWLSLSAEQRWPQPWWQPVWWTLLRTCTYTTGWSLQPLQDRTGPLVALSHVDVWGWIQLLLCSSFKSSCTYWMLKHAPQAHISAEPNWVSVYKRVLHCSCVCRFLTGLHTKGVAD